MFIITFDGFAGAGKSTLANLFSKKIGAFMLSTGDAHRINAYLMLQRNVNLDSYMDIIHYLQSINVEWTKTEGRIEISIDGYVLSDIDNDQVEGNLSKITSIPSVCSFFTDFFRSIKISAVLVVDGHGVGTGIFPYADMKLFCEADEMTRAKRRALQKKNNIETVLKNIQKRDEADRKRKVNPIYITQDMYVINTEQYSTKEAIDIITEKYEQCICAK